MQNMSIRKCQREIVYRVKASHEHGATPMKSEREYIQLNRQLWSCHSTHACIGFTKEKTGQTTSESKARSKVVMTGCGSLASIQIKWTNVKARATNHVTEPPRPWCDSVETRRAARQNQTSQNSARHRPNREQTICDEQWAGCSFVGENCKANSKINDDRI